MFPVSDDGLHGRGEISHEPLRHADTLGNPVMVQRGALCALRLGELVRPVRLHHRLAPLQGHVVARHKEEHALRDKAGTGTCGRVAPTWSAPGSGPSRMILRGWVCSADNTPCQYDGLVTDPKKRRVTYAAVLTWGDDGATPAVPAFLPAAG